MTDLDALLRTRAQTFLLDEAAIVDPDAELAAFRAAGAEDGTGTVVPLPTSAGRSGSTSGRVRQIDPSADAGGRRWLAVAAAVALVAGLGVALLASGRDSGDPVAPLDTTPATEVDGSATTTTSVTEQPVLPESLAEAEPSTVEAGGTVIVTPAAPVRRTCGDTVHVGLVAGTAVEAVGVIVDGRFEAGPDVAIPDCAGATTDEPLAVDLPASLASGSYRVCIAGPDEPAGCALVGVLVGTTTLLTIDGTVSPTEPSVDPGAGATDTWPASPVPYLGRRDVLEDADEPLTIVRYDGDGTVLGGLDDLDYADAVFGPVAVTPGTSFGTSRFGRPEGGRCTWNLIGSSSDVEDPGFGVDDVGDVLGIAGSGTGYVVVSRDVCPDGARWGDPGTYHEVVRYHLTDPSDPPAQIARSEADPDAIVFDDGANLVVAPGEQYPVSVDPTGRWVGVREWRTIEDVQYHVYDASLGAGETGWGAPLELATQCASPGHLAAIPRFEDVPALGGTVVVVARQCPDGTEEFIVEAVRLDDGEVVWSLAVDDVSINGYSGGLANLSTVVHDGELWVIVSGAAFEGPFRSALLQGDRQVGITTTDSDVLAFDVDDLIDDNEAYSSFGG